MPAQTDRARGMVSYDRLQWCLAVRNSLPYVNVQWTLSAMDVRYEKFKLVATMIISDVSL